MYNHFKFFLKYNKQIKSQQIRCRKVLQLSYFWLIKISVVLIITISECLPRVDMLFLPYGAFFCFSFIPVLDMETLHCFSFDLPISLFNSALNFRRLIFRDALRIKYWCSTISRRGCSGFVFDIRVTIMDVFELVCYEAFVVGIDFAVDHGALSPVMRLVFIWKKMLKSGDADGLGKYRFFEYGLADIGSGALR